MTDKIKIVPECWGQPGSIRYTYKHRMEKTLWNVSSYDGQTIKLWSINANGGTNHRSHQRINFWRDFEGHNKPSLYEQMDAVAKHRTS